MSDYTPTIGLEVHAELKTQTKMFCNSKNDSDETRPNVNVCPICMGHPGTLPVINKEAVKHVLKVGVAVGGALADFTEFDRKNYFYPDIPKGYQISQYRYPLVTGGSINGVVLTRIHLEEDTALSKHEGDHSLIDFNRAGIPLMELVTEPVIHSAEEAVAFAKELQLLLRYLGVSDANMEKGELRLEANISVGKNGEMGVKTEVKNLNSFRSVERAIEYELKRQTELLEGGGEVVQETRGWDEDKQETFSQRKKESSHDYRYFPEPDLPKLKISEIPEFAEDKLKAELPELPWEKRRRYLELFKIRDEDTELYMKRSDISSLFENTVSLLDPTHFVWEKTEGGGVKWKGEITNLKLVKLVSSYVISDILGFLNANPQRSLPDEKRFAELMQMSYEGDISSRIAKDILVKIIEENVSPRAYAKMNGLFQENDEGKLQKIAEQVVKDNPDVVAEYKAGKEASLQYLVGQCMRVSKGSADPQKLQDIFRKVLK